MSEPTLYTREWVHERAARGLVALRDSEVEVVAEVLSSLADYPAESEGTSHPPKISEVRVCRWCGNAIYLAGLGDGLMVGGTGRELNEHWRHVRGDERYCKRGNGSIAEPYDGSGPVADELRLITGKRA